MKLSVIIPYYNGEQWIGACLDSLIRQDLSQEEYEIIVVDDGATHSIETLMSYVERYPHIHYLHQKNQKHAAARNYGLTIAKGDYVFFCDCDDYVADNVFGRLCDIGEEEQADVLLFNVLCPKENETISSDKRNFDDRATFESGLAFISQPPYHFRGGVWRYLIRRSLIVKKHLRFDPKMVNREEHLFTLQLMLVAGKVVKVDVDVYFYVQHPTSWVHSAGMADNAKEFINCMTVFLKYLHKTRLELAANKSVSEGCLEAMERGEAQDTFAILYSKFLFFTIRENKEVICELRSLGIYPIRQRRTHFDMVRRLMNIYPLWMMLCVANQFLPSCVRKGVVRLLR